MECTYVPVDFCRGDDVCINDTLLQKRGRVIYVVRGSEMFALRLPQLPLADPSIGTGVEAIERILGGKKEETDSTKLLGGESAQDSSSKEGG